MSLTNAIRVVPKAAVSGHLPLLFKTPVMQKIAGDSRSPVHHICERIARGPLFTFTPPSFKVDPAAETNFTSWWRLLSLRTPKEGSHPFAEDMYLLHEYYHLANMPYFPDKFGFAEWREKMLINEQEASFYSEAWIYHIHPELRKEFPKAEIWADMFTHEQFQRDVFQEFLSRREICGLPTPDQLRTARFDLSNDLWCAEYWTIAQKVENHMARFHAKCDDGDDEELIREHLEFIDQQRTRLEEVANAYNKKWQLLPG